MIDLSVSFCGMKLKNPFVLASGIKGCDGESLLRAAKEGAGAITSKSCSLEPRPGHKNPTVIEFKYYVINAVGLSNPGVEEEIEHLKYVKSNTTTPLIASVYEKNISRFVEVAKKISLAKPDMIELDTSCPNLEGKLFCSDINVVADLVKEIKKEIKIPISVKLSAATENIGEIAYAAQSAGADCISAINTIPAMAIDIYAKKPILANKYGGLSGPAILPIALRAVNQIRQYCKIPIIGGGGVSSGEDAAAMIMAGANAVSVGSVLYKRKNAFKKLKNELIAYMSDMGFEKISDIKFS